MRQFLVLLTCAFSSILVLLTGATATPPDYKTFKRLQEIDRPIPSQNILRIWMFYVGQGDGMLIQLPERYSYTATDDSGEEYAERVDILVDGGPSRASDWRAITDLISDTYPGGEIILEHVVVTHHDEDHIGGVTQILNDAGIAVERIYHNGLASYIPSLPRFSDDVCEFPIKTRRSGRTTRIMGCVAGETDKEVLPQGDLVDSLSELKILYDAEKLQGVYERFAKAIVSKAAPAPVLETPRVFWGQKFILEHEQERDSNRDLSDLKFDLLWPRKSPMRFGDNFGEYWKETVNGNSVTFRLVYGDFSMLFTGDHNKHSEPALISFLNTESSLGLLGSDVLKVPHHGSDHSDKDFIKHASLGQVLSVASQGEKGAKSKKAFGPRSWQHPSNNIIRYLGGAHRVYLTQMHERRFSWSDLITKVDNFRTYERSHILIETDGEWFRLVEIPATMQELSQPNSVRQTRRGNGTRWIKAN